MKKKNIVFFMPLIRVGGVEKNLFLVSNFFSQKLNNIFVCTGSNKYKKRFSSKIKFLKPKKNFNDKLNIRLRYFFCLYILFKFLLKNQNTIVFCFQANVYCILLCKILIHFLLKGNSYDAIKNY